MVRLAKLIKLYHLFYILLVIEHKTGCCVNWPAAFTLSRRDHQSLCAPFCHKFKPGRSQTNKMTNGQPFLLLLFGVPGVKRSSRIIIQPILLYTPGSAKLFMARTRF